MLQATRFTDTHLTPVMVNTTRASLLRIYPVEGASQPIAIESDAFTVGRHDNANLSIADDSVSRNHATIQWDGIQHTVLDTSSTNGTFVNEERIVRSPLKPGDRVRFGNQIFKYLSACDFESQYHEAIFKVMTTDGLTQAYNKRYFLDHLQREMDQGQRSGQSLAVILMDLDKFKSVNDTYGHLAGDAVLVEFSQRARSVLRSGEVFARYGGEEFVMMCASANLEQGLAAAERIRVVTAASPFVHQSLSLPITVSLGVATLSPDQSLDVTTLLEQADTQLYRAKRAGRNQVFFEAKVS